MRLLKVENSVREKDYIYDTLLPDIINEFKQINIVKTPYRKYNYILKIMEYVNSLIKFNEGLDKEVGADDITPVLNYVFIKAHPFRIFSDLEFTKTLLNKTNDIYITNIESAYNYILESKPENYNFNKEEFGKNYIQILNNDNDQI